MNLSGSREPGGGWMGKGGVHCGRRTVALVWPLQGAKAPPCPLWGCVCQETVVVFIRPPGCVHVQPDRLISKSQPSPSRQGSMSHHCFVRIIRASTQAGRALVVPAICPFLHAQRAVCRAIVLRGWLLSRSSVTISQVPAAS